VPEAGGMWIYIDPSIDDIPGRGDEGWQSCSSSRPASLKVTAMSQSRMR
jgi:hypothetical protein